MSIARHAGVSFDHRWFEPRLSPAAAAGVLLARLRLLRDADPTIERVPARVESVAAAAGVPSGPPAGEGADGARGEDPDRELLAHVLAEYPHETRWFSRLVERHWRRTWSVCQAVLLDPEDAEEAAQDAFLRAHRYLPSFRFESTFRAWLVRIARNAALNLLAARRREREVRLGVREDPVLFAPWQPARAPSPDRTRLDLQRALEVLDERDRIVLVLHELEGVPYDEIAESLDLTAGTVRMAAMRARRRMREAMQKVERGTT